METTSSVAIVEHPCMTEYNKNMDGLLGAGYGIHSADAIVGLDFDDCLDRYFP